MSQASLLSCLRIYHSRRYCGGSDMGMRKYVREASFTIPVAGLAFHNLFLFALTLETECPDARLW